MIRVLHFKYALKTDGATSILLDLWEHMDPSRVACDLLLGDGKIPEQIQERLKAIRERGNGGGRVYSIAERCREKDRFFYSIHKIFFCCRLLQDGRYDVVHVHTEDAGRSLILLFAWLMGVKGRVVHSHNSFTQSGRLGAVRQEVFKRLLPVWTDGYIACSAQAARWMFPKSLLKRKKVVLLPNGIRPEVFCFSEGGRRQCRQELGLGEEPVFVLCAVGRLARQKNPAFLLQVLQVLRGAERELRGQSRSGQGGPLAGSSCFRLLFIGDGPQRLHLEELARKQGLSRQVLFLGERTDVPRLLWAADLFLLPSFFEGLPRALVEAQAAGLPCIVSDRVTREADLTGRVSYLPVEKGARSWAEKILEEIEKGRAPRESAERQVKEAGFDIRTGARRLEQYYDRFKKSGL